VVDHAEVLVEDRDRGACCGPGSMVSSPACFGVVHLHLLAPLQEIYDWLWRPHPSHEGRGPGQTGREEAGDHSSES
jgi:hypothetical protein